MDAHENAYNRLFRIYKLDAHFDISIDAFHTVNTIRIFLFLEKVHTFVTTFFMSMLLSFIDISKNFLNHIGEGLFKY